MVEKTMLGLIQDQETVSERLDLDYATLQHTTFPLLKSDPEPCRCAACGEQILERYYLLAVDKQWHVSCLKCSQCHLSLDSQLTCFEKDGHIYCKEDYYRRFAVKQCSRCREGITANELVMKARHLVFHLGCFTCASCNKVLTTGDHFGISGDTVFCRQHYQLALRTDLRVADLSPTDISPLSNMSPGADMSLGYTPGIQPNAAPLPFYNGTGAVQKGRPRKRAQQSTELDRCDQLIGAIQNEADMAYSQDGYVQMARQKRMRTSFKHHQLRTMKSYFSLNHNPDAKDLKQLAQKTGLSKRILQVWFQNARAKYRRNQLKQQDRSACGDDGGTCPTQDGGSFTLDDSCSNSSSKLTAAEASSGAHSPAASDISSSPSISVLRGNTSESESLPSGSALAGLFSSLHSGL